MWKLFITVLAMSDIGSVSTSVTVTDYDDEPPCHAAAAELTQPSVVKTLGGHDATISIKADCKPSFMQGEVQRRMQGMPPPMRGFENFLR